MTLKLGTCFELIQVNSFFEMNSFKEALEQLRFYILAFSVISSNVIIESDIPKEILFL